MLPAFVDATQCVFYASIRAAHRSDSLTKLAFSKFSACTLF